MIRIVAATIVLALVAAFALAPTTLLPVLAPDAAAPDAIERLLPEAKRSLLGHLDLQFAHLRYLGAETREADDLVILQFELRTVPYIAVDGAFLISRCHPIDEIDPSGMGGGRGVKDFATDPELIYLRSDEQPPCPLAR